MPVGARGRRRRGNQVPARRRTGRRREPVRPRPPAASVRPPRRFPVSRTSYRSIGSKPSRNAGCAPQAPPNIATRPIRVAASFAPSSRGKPHLRELREDLARRLSHLRLSPSHLREPGSDERARVRERALVPRPEVSRSIERVLRRRPRRQQAPRPPATRASTREPGAARRAAATAAAAHRAIISSTAAAADRRGRSPPSLRRRAGARRGEQREQGVPHLVAIPAEVRGGAGDAAGVHASSSACEVFQCGSRAGGRNSPGTRRRGRRGASTSARIGSGTSEGNDAEGSAGARGQTSTART